MNSTKPPGFGSIHCLEDPQLRELNLLAERCEQVYGPARDIEWALARGTSCFSAVPSPHPCLHDPSVTEISARPRGWLEQGL
jgi:hypothetical protein